MSEKAKHFTSCGYLRIKLPDGSRFDFRGTSREAVEEHAKNCRYRIERDQRRLDLLQAYLDGKTVQDPDALR